jgi:hypothetical protein
VTFLPPNTTSLLQPINHCVIAAFKLHYLRKTFSRCITVTDIKEGTGQEVIEILERLYSLRDGIKTI